MVSMSEEIAGYGDLTPEQVEAHLRPLRKIQLLEAMLDLTWTSSEKPSSE